MTARTTACCAALAALVLASGPAGADSADLAYDALPAPVYDVYEAMLNYADDGAFDRLGASLRHLEGLYRVLEASSAQPLKAQMVEALAKADAPLVRCRVLELIAVDLRRHLAAATAAKQSARVEQELQMAATLYSILSPSIRHGDAAGDAKIRSQMKELFRLERSSAWELSRDALLANLGASGPSCQPKVARR